MASMLEADFNLKRSFLELLEPSCTKPLAGQDTTSLVPGIASFWALAQLQGGTVLSRHRRRW